MSLEMKKRHSNAFLLLDEIAVRARRIAGEIKTARGFVYYLEAGEALVPTYSEMGMTKGQWRHAVKVLCDHYGQIETFKVNEGIAERTAARLISDEIFDINIDLKTRLESARKRAENATPKTTPSATPKGSFKDNDDSMLERQNQNHDTNCDTSSDTHNKNDSNNNESTNKPYVPSEHGNAPLAGARNVALSSQPDAGGDHPSEHMKVVDSDTDPSKVDYDAMTMDQLSALADNGDDTAHQLWCKQLQAISTSESNGQAQREDFSL